MEFDLAIVKEHVFERNWHGAEFTWKRDGELHRAAGRDKRRPYVIEVVSRP